MEFFLKTDFFFCIAMYIQLKEIIEKVNVGWDLVLFMGCWLDAGRSECEFAVSCKKGMGLCRLKKVEKSGMSHQREVCRFTGRMSYDILMKKKLRWNLKKKKMKRVDP